MWRVKMLQVSAKNNRFKVIFVKIKRTERDCIKLSVNLTFN